MEIFRDFFQWLVDGLQRFLPTIPALPSLWRFLVDQVGGVPLVAAFLVMLYFALGLATRAARTSDIRAFGKLILAIGLTGSGLLIGYFAFQARESAPVMAADRQHYEEMARRLGVQVAVPATRSFIEALIERIQQQYFFLLPCMVMMIVGALILFIFRKGSQRAANQSQTAPHG